MTMPLAPGSNVTIPLAQRWVATSAQDLAFTPDGLLDTRRMESEYYSGRRPDQASSLVGTSASYVLLAAGGAGKSTVIDQLRADEPNSGVVDLQLLTLSSLAAAIEEATGTFSTVYIDQLDEALQHEPRFGYAVTKLLAGPNAKVAWRIACRPASWGADLSQGFRAALPGFREFNLLPLDLQAVDLMAGSDASGFRAAVTHNRLGRLLARPLDVQDLLLQWRDSGRLAATRSESMRYSVGRLLDEFGPFRTPQHQDQQRMMLLAQHLASIAMFCGASRFVFSPSGATYGNATMAVASIPTADDPDLKGPPSTVDDFREVLGTSLFTSAGPDSVAFRHQAYEEFLTASLLARRNVGGRRLTALLGADTNGVAAGPMIEVLGWLLALNADVPADLLAANARPLLRTAGLELANESARAQIVAALLKGAANGTVDEGWGIDTSALAHPGLAEQLRTAAGAATNQWEIFWIARMARHCVVVDTTDDLLALAHNTSWPSHMRAEAAQSFAAVGPVDRLVELKDLLDVPDGEDPDDELHAAALRALAPVLDATELGNAIRARRRSNFIGSYSALLSELAGLVRPEYVFDVLEAVLTAHGESDDLAMTRLIGGLAARVWDAADADVGALARLGELMGRNRHDIRAMRRSDYPMPWVTNDRPADRHAVAVAALEQHKHARMTVIDLGLLNWNDTISLLDWLPSAPVEQQQATLSVLHQLASNPTDAATADRVLEVPAGHPAFTILSNLRGHQPITDRPNWVQDNMDRAAKRPTLKALQKRLEDSIAATRNDLDLWPDVVEKLAGHDDHISSAHAKFGWDLTRHALWPNPDTDDAEGLWDLALKYVNGHRPKPARWDGTYGYSTEAVKDWAGVAVFGTVALHRPELLDEIADDVWADWMPSILRAPLFDQATEALTVLRGTSNPALLAAMEAVVIDLAASDPLALLNHPWGNPPDADPDGELDGEPEAEAGAERHAGSDAAQVPAPDAATDDELAQALSTLKRHGFDAAPV